jgi:hypothetical protein
LWLGSGHPLVPRAYDGPGARLYKRAMIGRLWGDLWGKHAWSYEETPCRAVVHLRGDGRPVVEIRWPGCRWRHAEYVSHSALPAVMDYLGEEAGLGVYWVEDWRL